jgi:hypothetical protein
MEMDRNLAKVRVAARDVGKCTTDLSAHVGWSLSPLRALELVMFYASLEGRSYRA